MSLHRSKFFSVQNYTVYPKSLKEMLEALGLSLEDLMSPNTTEAFTTKNFF